MGDSERTIEMVKHAETFTITWGKKFNGKTMDECPNSYLRYISENFNQGYPKMLAEALLEWREKNGVKI